MKKTGRFVFERSTKRYDVFTPADDQTNINKWYEPIGTVDKTKPLVITVEQD